jgi:hypothetical protein
VHEVAGALSMLHVKVAPGLVAWKVKAALRELLCAGGAESITVSGELLNV